MLELFTRDLTFLVAVELYGRSMVITEKTGAWVTHERMLGTWCDLRNEIYMEDKVKVVNQPKIT